jgi:hypothetical protein
MTEEEKEKLRVIKEIDSLSVNDSAGYKNLIAIQDYAKKTREMFRALQKENAIDRNQVKEQAKVIEMLNKQIQQLHIKLYQNGPTQR